MADKMRALQTYLRLQIQETERQMFAAAHRHDTTTAAKWQAVSDAYEDCYTRIFGKLEEGGNDGEGNG